MQEAIRITAVVKKQSMKPVVEALRSVGVDYAHVEPGREPILEEKRGLRALLGGPDSLMSEPVSVLTMYVPPEAAEPLMHLLSDRAGLHRSGMGILYSEKTILRQKRPICHPAIGLAGDYKKTNLFSDVEGIYCLVQRGEGDRIVRTILEAGFAVPTVTYGEGMGLRDRLGLLRITIPADKEIITLILPRHDVDEAMELIIEAGKIDRPGRGFINTFPVEKAILNTRIYLGGRKQAASMEQVVAALDSLKGNLEWRMKGEKFAGRKRRFLQDLIELRLRCSEGEGKQLISIALKEGASGATITRSRFLDIGSDPSLEEVPVASEIASLSVSQEMAEKIIEALHEQAGFPDEQGTGSILTRPVPTALTYLGETEEDR